MELDEFTDQYRKINNERVVLRKPVEMACLELDDVRAMEESD